MSETNYHPLILHVFTCLSFHLFTILFVYCISSLIECKFMREGTYLFCSVTPLAPKPHIGNSRCSINIYSWMNSDASSEEIKAG